MIFYTRIACVVVGIRGRIRWRYVYFHLTMWAKKVIGFLAIILSPNQAYLRILVDGAVYNYCLAANSPDLFYTVLYFIVIYCMVQGGASRAARETTS